MTMTPTAIYAQGEITIRRMPRRTSDDGYSPMSAQGRHLIVGHSETGHHHVLDAAHADVLVKDRPPEGMRILKAIVHQTTSLVHLREHDTHDPIVLEPGEWELRIGREYDPYEELARIQAD